MILRPHDLLRLSDLAGLLDASDWVRSTFSRTPWVVVRRGDAPAGRVAAGVRGDDRSHRYALTVSEGQIGDVVTPEDLGAVDLAAARDLPRAARARRCAKVPRGARDALGPDRECGIRVGDRRGDRHQAQRPRPGRAGRCLTASVSQRLTELNSASHCPLQADTATRLSEHLADVPRRSPAARYLTNTRARSVGTADEIIGDLAEAVSHPVQWYDATRLMGELGVTCAVQMPPGRVLVALTASAVPDVTSDSLSDSGFQTVAAIAHRHAGSGHVPR